MAKQQQSIDNSPLTQREFDRFLVDNRNNIKEIKDSIKALDNKLDKIVTTDIPNLKIHDAKLSTKTKAIWSVFITGITTVVTILLQLAKASIGL